jgi:hypothetical protein
MPVRPTRVVARRLASDQSDGRDGPPTWRVFAGRRPTIDALSAAGECLPGSPSDRARSQRADGGSGVLARYRAQVAAARVTAASQPFHKQRFSGQSGRPTARGQA